MPEINFYVPDEETYLEGMERTALTLEADDFFVNSQRAWIVQTFLHLKETDLRVTVNNRLVKGAINVVHCDEMIGFKNIRDYYIVCIVSDRRVFLGGNLNVVQNELQRFNSRYFFIMHWPQRKLIRSLGGRDERKVRVGFLGLKENTVDLEAILHRSSVGDKIDLIYRGPEDWNDYSDLDIVVAVRDFVSAHPEKPPTKLVNAWRAGVVFIGGKDSAYVQIGAPGVNYIKCRSPQELVLELRNLIAHPEIRRKFIEEGHKASLRFSDSHITDQWVNFFEEFAISDYEIWQRQTIFQRVNFRVKSFFCYMMLRARRFLLLRMGRY